MSAGCRRAGVVERGPRWGAGGCSSPGERPAVHSEVGGSRLRGGRGHCRGGAGSSRPGKLDVGAPYAPR